MITSTHNPKLTQEIYMKLRKAAVERELAHTRSGKLSAGKLGAPLLEQVLYVIGVPTKPNEDYTLGLFRRGSDVEDAICGLIEPDEQQVEVFYRDTIGIVDAIRNGMVYEIKSVKSSMWQYIDPTNTQMKRAAIKGNPMERQYTGPKRSHVLQAVQNGLALGKDQVTVLYVCADDYRTAAHIISVAEVKPEVDRVIDQFNAQLESKMLPRFEPLESWQTNPQYSNYPDWISLEPEQMMEKLKQQYPESYKRLVGEE
jgi:hypothetical protein